MTTHNKIQQKILKKAIEHPMMFDGDFNVIHWLSEKAKIYARFQNGLPSQFDSIRVEYAEPEYGWMDTIIYVNDKKTLVIPMSDVYNPLGRIITWLEELIDGDYELNEHYAYLDCEGCHAILHYEQLHNTKVTMFAATSAKDILKTDENNCS